MVRGQGEGDTPLVVTPDASTAGPRDWVWSIEAAELARRQGFAPLAVRLYRSVLDHEDLPAGIVSLGRLGLATSLLAEDRGAEVLEIFMDMPSGPRVDLRRGLAHYLVGDMAAAEASFASYDSADLPPDDRAWHFAGKGLLRMVADDGEEASRLFRAAEEAAGTEALKAHFRLLRLRGDLRHGEASEDMIARLRATSRTMAGQVLGFEANRLLAFALHRLGRVNEAIAVTEELLQQPGVMDSPRREELLLALGLMLGDDSGRGRVALRQLLTLSADPRRQRTALALLSAAPLQGEYRNEFRDFISQLLRQEERHPQFAQLLVTRAALSAQAGHYDAAESDALRLLEELPGSELLPEALRMLAYVNWRRSPPRYRTAASYLDRLRPLVRPGAERARIFAQMGDCFFLNEDYANAAEAYLSAQREGELVERGTILFQQVLSEIRAGRLEAAARALDDSPLLSSARRWEAEYTLLDALREAGESDTAFDRVRRLLALEEHEQLSIPLQARLRWMEARLALDADRAAEVPQLSDALLSWMETGAGATLDPSEREPIRSHVLLLEGEALFQLGLPAEGMAVLRRLREEFPDSGPEMLSYLLESRLSAAGNSVVDAQVSLINLADRFPHSRYAPIALWEAALLAEQRGLDSAYREAMGIIDRLYRNYPGHPITYYARIKQGDLSRRLNDFGTALAIYEGVLAEYPDHEERYRAELSRGDCLLARGSASVESLVAASVVFERLFEDLRTPVDAAVEAGYKWMTSLRQRDLPMEAMEASIVLKSRFFNDPDLAAQLGSRGRYWMARALIDFATHLEAEASLESLEQAGVVYEEIVASGLPGRAIAESRLARLRPSLTPGDLPQ